MTTGMLGTEDDRGVKLIGSLPIRQANHEAQAEDTVRWFRSLSKQEKRFHILFYALAALTGILIVQLIWQIAILTVR